MTSFPTRNFQTLSGAPDGFLLMLNTAWGGDLIVDGAVSYRDGRCLEKMWVWSDGRWTEVAKWIVRQDSLRWNAADAYNTRSGGDATDQAILRILKRMDASTAFCKELLDASEVKHKEAVVDSKEDGRIR